MKLEVKDMSCSGCANSIRRAVASVDPAAKLDIDLDTKIVQIDSAAQAGKLIEAIEAAGYEPVQLG